MTDMAPTDSAGQPGSTTGQGKGATMQADSTTCSSAHSASTDACMAPPAAQPREAETIPAASSVVQVAAVDTQSGVRTSPCAPLPPRQPTLDGTMAVTAAKAAAVAEQKLQPQHLPQAAGSAGQAAKVAQGAGAPAAGRQRSTLTLMNRPGMGTMSPLGSTDGIPAGSHVQSVGLLRHTIICDPFKSQQICRSVPRIEPRSCPKSAVVSHATHLVPSTRSVSVNHCSEDRSSPPSHEGSVAA